MSVLEIRLLGEFEVRFNGELQPFTAPPRALPLLAMLLLAPGPVPRGQLATAVWPDENREDARTNLRRHLHRIVQALPDMGAPWTSTEAGAVCWNRELPVTVDALEFERLAGDIPQRIHALDLYRGDLMPAATDEWIVARRERLRSLFLSTAYDCAVDARRERRYPEAAAFAERILHVDPWREDAVRVAMSARYELGDRAAALAAFESFASMLMTEMHVVPMPETCALREAILANESISLAGRMADAGIASVGSQLPFVGRGREVDELRSAWQRAARGNGGVCFVVGDPGIGKSRLLAEIALEVEEQGGRVLYGTSSKPESQPYQPIVEALRRGLPLLIESDVEFVWLSALAPLVPEIEALVPGLPAAPELDGEATRVRLFAAIAHAFAALARTRPVLLALEDIHWSGKATLEALEALARFAGGLPLLVIATYRADESAPGSALRDLRRALQRQNRAVAISLRPLSADDIAGIVAEGDIARRVFARSEGNPLFVAQLLRGYEETGALPDEASAMLSLRDVILGRIDSLDARTRAVAEVAATIGVAFSLEIVGSVGGWPEYEIVDAISLLLDRSLVREVGGGRFDYAFSHALIRLAVYDASDAGVRAGRHARIAAALAAHGGASAEAAARAFHWERAGNRARARAAYADAARAALDVSARADGLGYARRALDLADGDGEIFVARGLAAEALAADAGPDAWHEEIAAMSAAAASLGPEERFAAAGMEHAHAVRTADAAGFESAARTMREIAEALDDDARRARVYECEGIHLLWQGRIDEAVASLRAGSTLAAHADPSLLPSMQLSLIRGLARLGRFAEAGEELAAQQVALPPDDMGVRRLNVLRAQSLIAAITDDTAACERVGREMLELGRASGAIQAEAFAHATLAQAAHLAHDVAGMRSHYDSALELFDRLGDIHARFATFINRGFLEREIGHLDDALGWWNRCEADLERIASLDGLANLAMNRAEVYVAQGRRAEAFGLAADGVRMARETGEVRLVADALTIEGSAFAAFGGADEAVARLREACAIEGASVRSSSQPYALLIELLVRLGRTDEAAAPAATLAAMLDERPDDHRYPSRCCLALASHASARGDEACAAGWIERGRAIVAAMTARLADRRDRDAYLAMPFNRALAEAPSSASTNIPAPGGSR